MGLVVISNRRVTLNRCATRRCRLIVLTTVGLLSVGRALISPDASIVSYVSGACDASPGVPQVLVYGGVGRERRLPVFLFKTCNPLSHRRSEVLLGIDGERNSRKNFFGDPFPHSAQKSQNTTYPT